jgi:hypothetical protein
MHTLSAREFARQSDTNLMRLLDLAERGKRVCNIDLAEYGRFDQRGELKAVKVPDRLMPNLGPGRVSESSAADAFEAGVESVGSGASATMDGEPVPVEVQEEDEGDGDELPVRKPERKGTVGEFGRFALYTGMAVGVGLALKRLLGGGDRAL